MWPTSPPEGWPFLPWGEGAPWPPPAPAGWGAGTTEAWGPPPAGWSVRDWAYYGLPSPAGTDASVIAQQILAAHGPEFPQGTRLFFIAGDRMIFAEMPLPNGTRVYIRLGSSHASWKVFTQAEWDATLGPIFGRARTVASVAPYSPAAIPDVTDVVTAEEIAAALRANEAAAASLRPFGVVRIVSAALTALNITSWVLQGRQYLMAVASDNDWCNIFMSRVTSALFEAKVRFQALAAAYAALWNRLEDVTDRCTGNASQEEAVWLAHCRANLGDAIGEIQRRLDRVTAWHADSMRVNCDLWAWVPGVRDELMSRWTGQFITVAGELLLSAASPGPNAPTRKSEEWFLDALTNYSLWLPAMYAAERLHCNCQDDDTESDDDGAPAESPHLDELAGQYQAAAVCPPGYWRHDNGNCYPNTPTGNADCPPDRPICHDGVCVGCVTSDDCPDGSHCANGLCVPDEPPEDPPTESEMRAALGTAQGQPGYNPRCDLDGDGDVDFTDLAMWRQLYGG